MQFTTFEWFRNHKEKIGFSLNALYRCMGVSKQSVHQAHHRQVNFDESLAKLLLEVEELREEHPGCGIEKMYYTLQPDFLGRDKFIEIFMNLGYRVQKKPNYKRTTYAGLISYPNLIKGKKVSKPCTIWQSDITYIDVGGKFYYAVFIIDVYTKKIVGYNLGDHMRATANITALEIALKGNKAPDIHHSDRGSQYTSNEYLTILNNNGIEISMSGSAQENAYAERINRTIKEEYIERWQPKTFEELKKYLSKAVAHYNEKRQHKHLNRLTPIVFEQKWNSKQLAIIPEFAIYNDEAA